jgi:DNA-binding beta-propeller fold protein YncE
VDTVGSESEGIAVDPRTGIAAISFRDPARIELVDIESGRVLKRVPTPDPARHLSLAGPGGPVLAPIEYRDLVLRIELPSGRTSSSVRVGDFPHDAVETADGRVFVGDEGGDTVSVISGETVEDDLPVPEQPGGVAASGDLVGVVAVAARVIAFIDTRSLETVAELPAGAGPSHVVAGADGRFYVVDTGGDALLVYGTRPEPELLDRTNLPGSPYGIAIDERHRRIWVTTTADNRLHELEITDLAPKLVDSFPTVRQPNSVGVDERTGAVVVVGREDGDVQIFNPPESAR